MFFSSHWVLFDIWSNDIIMPQSHANFTDRLFISNSPKHQSPLHLYTCVPTNVGFLHHCIYVLVEHISMGYFFWGLRSLKYQVFVNKNLHDICDYFMLKLQKIFLLLFHHGFCVCMFYVSSPFSLIWLFMCACTWWCLGYIINWFGLLLLYAFNSEITAEGRRITKLDQILLNGNNIAIVSVKYSIVFYLPNFYGLLIDHLTWQL